MANAETKDEVMKKIIVHGKTEHRIEDEEFTPEMKNRAMNSIKEI
ncbi:MAG: DUF1059 domain-containing protein [Patescibacteria group bacterium]|nr:DUF1059 domain-containing protein [Patescibacteria group bacterium]